MMCWGLMMNLDLDLGIRVQGLLVRIICYTLNPLP